MFSNSGCIDSEILEGVTSCELLKTKHTQQSVNQRAMESMVLLSVETEHSSRRNYGSIQSTSTLFTSRNEILTKPLSMFDKLFTKENFLGVASHCRKKNQELWFCDGENLASLQYDEKLGLGKSKSLTPCKGEVVVFNKFSFNDDSNTRQWSEKYKEVKKPLASMPDENEEYEFFFLDKSAQTTMHSKKSWIFLENSELIAGERDFWVDMIVEYNQTGGGLKRDAEVFQKSSRTFLS